MTYKLWYQIYVFKSNGEIRKFLNFDCEFLDPHPIVARNKAFERLELIDWLVKYLGYTRSQSPTYMISKSITFEISDNYALEVTGDDAEDLIHREDEYNLMREYKFTSSELTPIIIVDKPTGDIFETLPNPVTPSKRFMSTEHKI